MAHPEFAAKALDRDQMARRVAAELQSDWVVNIGIGMPTKVIPHVPAERDIIFHSENGIIGMGPEIDGVNEVDNDLLSAGKRPVSLNPGGSFVHHADSFALARNGRLDATILGAYQVASNGDLANWKLPGARAGNIGGAMDLAAGARRVLVMMTHVTGKGEPKLVERLRYPPTALGVVRKVFTDLAVLSVTDKGFHLDEIVEGLTPEDVQRVTDAPLYWQTAPAAIRVLTREKG
ncbi:MAG: 3-oxoadipate CoA-transferase, beta subunit [Rhodobacteraceae bacterium HLUCCA12]|nr:MAG: 3-oxoadipate CoA-transferase, beta subunit [Rhodobacteraceae bacterium HLUCCA12]